MYTKHICIYIHICFVTLSKMHYNNYDISVNCKKKKPVASVCMAPKPKTLISCVECNYIL